MGPWQIGRSLDMSFGRCLGSVGRGLRRCLSMGRRQELWQVLMEKPWQGLKQVLWQWLWQVLRQWQWPRQISWD